MHERIELDLEDFRAAGKDVPQTAQAHYADWLAAGHLERRFASGAIEEEYEISAAAAQTIRSLQTFIARRTTPTSSRLSAVIKQLPRQIEE